MEAGTEIETMREIFHKCAAAVSLGLKRRSNDNRNVMKADGD
jgi:hypothetical protein